jgi:hypothetical protein
MQVTHFGSRRRKLKRGDEMLLIRSEQMTSLDRSAFRHRLWIWMRGFRKSMPSQTEAFSDSELETLLESGLSAAREYGLTSEFFQREYLRVILLTGADGDGRPSDGIIRITMEESGSETEKMDRLAVLVPDPDAAEQDRVALQEARRHRKGLVEAQNANEEPERPIEPHFLLVDGREAAPEPLEWNRN